MSTRCTFETHEGRLCKRWAVRGSHFCFNHLPARDTTKGYDGASLHPLARLSCPEDIFDVLRETLNAVRLGRIHPAQAYAVSHVAQVLLKVYERVRIERRDDALDRQIIPTLADEESCAETDSALALALPVEAEPIAATAPPLLRGAVQVASRVSAEAVAEFNRLAALLVARAKSNGAAAPAHPPPGPANGDAPSPAPAPANGAAAASARPIPTNGGAPRAAHG